MEFRELTNYVVLANDTNKEFLNNFKDYIILNDYSYKELKEKLENFTNRQVVFNETLYGLKKEERKEIENILKIRNINYINITSNIEDTLLGNYIYVYDKDNLVLKGTKEEVLKNEKILKKIGYGLPFVVDLSMQLNYYDIFDKVYYDLDNLLEDLWN